MVMICKDVMTSLARLFDESMLTFAFSKVVKDSIRGVSEFDRPSLCRAKLSTVPATNQFSTDSQG